MMEKNHTKTLKLAVIGEFNPEYNAHQAVNDAVKHSIRQLSKTVDIEWISTDNISQYFDDLSCFNGFWLAPGGPYANMGNTLQVIKLARRNNWPLLGTCAGFQYILIEYARHALGIEDADSQETNPNSANLIINRLPCSLVGKTQELFVINKSSKVYQILDSERIEESYLCNFGLNPDYQETLKNSAMDIVIVDEAGEGRAVELKDNDFFVGTLFLPQLKSTEDRPHPLVLSFIEHLK